MISFELELIFLHSLTVKLTENLCIESYEFSREANRKLERRKKNNYDSG